MFIAALLLALAAAAPAQSAQENKASGDGILTVLPHPEVVDLSVTFSAKSTPDGFGKASFTWYEGIQGQPLTGPYSWSYVTGLTFNSWPQGDPKVGGQTIFYVAYQPGTLLADYVRWLSAAKYASDGSVYCPPGDLGFTYQAGDWVKILATDEDNYSSDPGAKDQITISARYCDQNQGIDGSLFDQSWSTQGDIKVKIYN